MLSSVGGNASLSGIVMVPKRKGPNQIGRVPVRMIGDDRLIVYPDGGVRALKHRVKPHRSKQRDGFGSHRNGKHKLG